MLDVLYIRNYAIIREVTINWASGLNIITGETGAGKSILIGALELVMGQRADTKVLFDEKKKCIIEAIFTDVDVAIGPLLDEAGIEFNTKQLIVRREINHIGKSRCFINDTPTSLKVLKGISFYLIHLHAQHDSLALQESSFQMQIIDILAQNQKHVSAYREVLERYKQANQDLLDLEARAKNARQEHDFFEFQYNELVSSDLQQGEEETLEKEQKILENTADIQSCFQQALHLLEDDRGILSQLKMLSKHIDKLAGIDALLKDLSVRVEQGLIEWQEISYDMQAIGQDAEPNPERLVFVQERLSFLFRLMQKHQVNSVEGLLDKQENLAENIKNLSLTDTKIEALHVQIHGLKTDLEKRAIQIRKRRYQTIPNLRKRVVSQLKKIGMPHADFDVELRPTNSFSIMGTDTAHFLFSANKGVKLKSLKDSASGGELSRIMLCVKSIIAENVKMATLIFDEIDTGISGEVASNVGILLEQVALKHQLVSITHLPQIASCGGMHWLVYKQTYGDSTHTHIKALSYQERILAIARMLSGNTISNEALAQATLLLKNQIHT